MRLVYGVDVPRFVCDHDGFGVIYAAPVDFVGQKSVGMPDMGAHGDSKCSLTDGNKNDDIRPVAFLLDLRAAAGRIIFKKCVG